MLQEERMDPPPDFGYDDYKGTGKLKNKVHRCLKWAVNSAEEQSCL